MSGFFASGTWWDVGDAEQEAIRAAAKRLEEAGITGAIDEARQLFVLSQGHETPATTFETFIGRRAAREPFSHLSGVRDFYKHRFHVTPDVLDPRPDTEVLVVEALQRPFKRVLDLGTGSGCILLSLLADRPEATGVGTDISPRALDVAKRNATELDVASRSDFILSDWYASVTDRFDLVISNPPYIAAVEMETLQPEVRSFEPRLALTDEGDGLSCYRTIIAGAHRHLTEGGTLMVEIGPTQAAAVSAMMQVEGFAEIAVIKDLDGRNRVVSAQFRGI